MANPPFNQDGVDKDRLKDDPRFKLGLPKPDNANYVWIQVFASSLNESGRAGFVMANSATDARGTEQDLSRLSLVITLDELLNRLRLISRRLKWADQIERCYHPLLRCSHRTFRSHYDERLDLI